MLWKILTHALVFLAYKVSLFSLYQFQDCGFWFDRIFISEALFTFPVKHFMQEFDDFE